MRLRIRNRLIWLAAFATVGFGGVLISSTSFAATTIQASICRTSYLAPAITEPDTALDTKDTTLIVKGTGEPTMRVTILNNGNDDGSALVAADGTFALQIPLAVGDNTLMASESDGCTTQQSPAINVHRTAVIPPPGKPAETSPTAPPSQMNTGTSFGGFPLPGSATSPSLQQPSPPSAVNDSGLMRPVILQPRDGQLLNSAQTWVFGKAQPGSVVSILLNGKEVARILVGEDGTFGAQVSLKRGKNTLQAVSTLADQSAASEDVAVQFRPSSFASSFSWKSVYWVLLLLLILLIVIIFVVWRRHRQCAKENGRW